MSARSVWKGAGPASTRSARSARIRRRRARCPSFARRTSRAKDGGAARSRDEEASDAGIDGSGRGTTPTIPARTPANGRHPRLPGRPGRCRRDRRRRTSGDAGHRDEVVVVQSRARLAQSRVCGLGRRSYPSGPRPGSAVRRQQDEADAGSGGTTSISRAPGHTSTSLIELAAQHLGIEGQCAVLVRHRHGHAHHSRRHRHAGTDFRHPMSPAAISRIADIGSVMRVFIQPGAFAPRRCARPRRCVRPPSASRRCARGAFATRVDLPHAEMGRIHPGGSNGR